MAAVRGEGGEGGGDCSGRQSVGYGRGEGCEAAAMQPCRGLCKHAHFEQLEGHHATAETSGVIGGDALVAAPCVDQSAGRLPPSRQMVAQ